MFNDGPIFIGLARMLSSGDFAAALTHPFHPLYPLAISVTQIFFERWDQAAVAVSILAGTASTAALFVFLRGAFNRQLAWIGALLFAVHPYAVAHSADVQSDGLYTFLFLSAVALLWKSCRARSVGAALATGLVAGLAYLCRPEGLGVALVGVGIFGLMIVLGKWEVRRGICGVAALVAGMLLFVLPYVTALHAQSGVWMITQKKSVSLAVVPVRPSPLAQEAMLQDPFLETVVRGSRVPKRVADVSAPNPTGLQRVLTAGFALFQTLADAMRWEIVVLAFLGALGGLRSRPSREAFVGVLVCAYLVVLFMLAFQSGYVSRRHTLPIGILLLGYAAAGVPVAGKWGVENARRLWPSMAPATPFRAALVGVCLVMLIAIPVALQEKRGERVAEREAAEWLSRQPAARGAPVASYKQRTAYYAGAPHVRLPDGRTPDAIATLRAAGARFVIIDEGDLVENPALSRATHTGLQVIYRTPQVGRKAVVYAIPGGEGFSLQSLPFAGRAEAG
jgi:4-amino-4-deoxy-L-arabinose transferase-like glycosyltransferase